MAERPRSIVHVNYYDDVGGAARMAMLQHHGCLQRGFHSVMAVGRRRGDDPSVIELANARPAYARAMLRLSCLASDNGYVAGRVLGRALKAAADPLYYFERALGIENFNYPGIWRLLSHFDLPPDLIHCHNLHLNYFDLRALPIMCKRAPVVLTMHDAWLLSGHCAHSFDCERWKTGCGSCPDLTVYPGIRRDATAHNWRRKRGIFSRSRLYLTTPCQWLMDKVKQSILEPAIADSRVIVHGVDRSVFHYRDKIQVRKELEYPADAKIVLIAADSFCVGDWKDSVTAIAALAKVRRDNEGLLIVGIGATGLPIPLELGKVRLIPYEHDPVKLARYYQAADVFLHPARADTFPYVVLESLACGTPVVATAVGGIPEQIRSGATGFLTSPGEADAMASAISELLQNDALRKQMGENAVSEARKRFDLSHQVSNYLDWYEHVMVHRKDETDRASGCSGAFRPPHKSAEGPE